MERNMKLFSLGVNSAWCQNVAGEQNRKKKGLRRYEVIELLNL